MVLTCESDAGNGTQLKRCSMHTNVVSSSMQCLLWVNQNCTCSLIGLAEIDCNDITMGHNQSCSCIEHMTSPSMKMYSLEWHAMLCWSVRSIALPAMLNDRRGGVDWRQVTLPGAVARRHRVVGH